MKKPDKPGKEHGIDNGRGQRDAGGAHARDRQPAEADAEAEDVAGTGVQNQRHEAERQEPAAAAGGDDAVAHRNIDHRQHIGGQHPGNIAPALGDQVRPVVEQAQRNRKDEEDQQHQHRHPAAKQQRHRNDGVIPAAITGLEPLRGKRKRALQEPQRGDIAQHKGGICQQHTRQVDLAHDAEQQDICQEDREQDQLGQSQPAAEQAETDHFLAKRRAHQRKALRWVTERK